MMMLYQSSVNYDNNNTTLETTAAPASRSTQIMEHHRRRFSGINRGIVVCLYDNIVPLGISLILELRCLEDYSAIQVCHCSDSELSTDSRARLMGLDPLIQIVDVCAEFKDNEKMVKSFQSYWIKPLALIRSSFEEVMLIDADAIFMQSPHALWQVKGYQRTGTLFFRDRPMAASKFLGKKVADPTDPGKTIPMIQYVFRTFDPKPFVRYRTVGLRGGSNDDRVEPSTEFRHSFVWDGKSGHYQESSVVLFNKPKQPRAVKIMEEFILRTRFTLKEFAWGEQRR